MIIAATPADLPEVQRLVQEAAHFLARRVDRVFFESDTLVMRVDDLLVGRGYGHRLLDAAEGLIGRRGRSLARLDCVVSNGRLRRYYEAAGYHQIRETDFGGRADIPRCGLYEKAL